MVESQDELDELIKEWRMESSCKFNHTDKDRMPHKCDVTCDMSLRDAATWMNKYQNVFTYLASDPIRIVKLRFRMKEMFPDFLSRTVND